MKNESHFEGSFFWFYLCYPGHFVKFGTSFLVLH